MGECSLSYSRQPKNRTGKVERVVPNALEAADDRLRRYVRAPWSDYLGARACPQDRPPAAPSKVAAAGRRCHFARLRQEVTALEPDESVAAVGHVVAPLQRGYVPPAPFGRPREKAGSAPPRRNRRGYTPIVGLPLVGRPCLRSPRAYASGGRRSTRSRSWLREAPDGPDARSGPTSGKPADRLTRASGGGRERPPF